MWSARRSGTAWRGPLVDRPGARPDPSRIAAAFARGRHRLRSDGARARVAKNGHITLERRSIMVINKLTQFETEPSLLLPNRLLGTMPQRTRRVCHRSKTLLAI
jgi:hypothetical protein